MVGVLIRKQIHEHLAYFKRNRKNIDVVGMLLSAVLMALVLFVIMKPKQAKNVPSDLDDFDLEDEEEYIDEEITE